MQLEIIILSEVSQKEKFHMIPLTCGNQKMAQMNVSKNRPRELTCDYQGMGGGAGEADGEGWTGSLGLVDATY